MKKIISLILLLCVLTTSAGCTKADNLKDVSTEGNSKSSDTLHSQLPDDYSDMILTKEEMLVDYDAIWLAYKENSPFLGLIERRHGADYLNSTIEKNRKRIIEMEATGDDSMLEFIIIIAESMAEACDVDGHAGIQNSTQFFEDQKTYRELYDEMPTIKPWLDVLEDQNVTQFYKYFNYLIERMMSNQEESNSSEAESQEVQSESDQDNLTMEILENGKTAYIKVDSFATEQMSEDLPKICTFLNEVKDYDHLIIDIQDNGGGNAEYWEKALVCPNISEPVTSKSVRLMKKGELAERYYGADYMDSALSVSDVQNDPAFLRLNGEDMEQFAFARESNYTLEPESKEKIFQGKVWVLVSSQVYSSAESFAVFCKDTGFATLVGKTTGGGNTGGPVLFELPNSHLLVSFDVEYALNPDGSCSQEIGTIPDIESENALQDVLGLIKNK